MRIWEPVGDPRGFLAAASPAGERRLVLALAPELAKLAALLAHTLISWATKVAALVPPNNRPTAVPFIRMVPALGPTRIV